LVELPFSALSSYQLLKKQPLNNSKTINDTKFFEYLFNNINVNVIEKNRQIIIKALIHKNGNLTTFNSNINYFDRIINLLKGEIPVELSFTLFDNYDIPKTISLQNSEFQNVGKMEFVKSLHPEEYPENLFDTQAMLEE
jgi:hypothetical protein